MSVRSYEGGHNLKKIVLAIGVGALVALPGTAAGFGPSKNPHAVATCGTTIETQTANGVSAGGGPKAGVPGPTGCDHYFQSIGAIGNGLPGGGTP